jgi:hypothetical protein
MKPEVDKIRYIEIQKFVKAILLKCDDTNATGSASSSGKYHPSHELGEGGLVRHAKSVARNVERMLQCMPQYDGDEEWSIVYGAAILHDFCKYKKDQKFTQEDHPRLMADMIRDMAAHDERFGWAPGTDYTDRMADCVASHMSRWNKLKYMKGDDLQTPRNPEQMILPYADMLASSKWFKAEFDSDNNIID